MTQWKTEVFPHERYEDVHCRISSDEEMLPYPTTTHLERPVKKIKAFYTVTNHLSLRHLSRFTRLSKPECYQLQHFLLKLNIMYFYCLSHYYEQYYLILNKHFNTYPYLFTAENCFYILKYLRNKFYFKFLSLSLSHFTLSVA